MIDYHEAPDIMSIAKEIANHAGFDHLDFSRIIFLRSKGSKAKRTIARCHGMGKIWQSAFDIKGHYIIEVISEHFDDLPEKEKIKTIIHELMHIPKSMGGGFRHHKDHVHEHNINKVYKRYVSRKGSNG